jgi:hypothetical protein
MSYDGKKNNEVAATPEHTLCCENKLNDHRIRVIEKRGELNTSTAENLKKQRAKQHGLSLTSYFPHVQNDGTVLVTS